VIVAAVALGWLVLPSSVPAQVASPVTQSPPVPDTVVDLTTAAGLELTGAQWRVAEAEVVGIKSTSKSGAPAASHDISPKAGGVEFDDRGWTVLSPESIHARLGGGRFSFEWFRTRITLPERIGQTPVDGATVVLNTTVDDYAEVWVDGKLPVILGASGGAVIRGWNAPSRVVLSDHARAGQKIQVAIFAANGPLSDPPGNYVWLRSASLELYQPDRLTAYSEAPLRVVRKNAGLDRLLGSSPKLERLASGFSFIEGPVWHSDGYLLFSDPNRNVIHRFAPSTGEVSVYMANSGFAGGADQAWGGDIGLFKQPGSNGLAIDREGRLTICQHGNRRVVRIERNGDVAVLADRLDGKRLNSPNDCVYRSDGVLFFTDPPFGLPRFHDDPRREVDATGVYCVTGLSGGPPQLKLISRDLTGPNGLAFSPDERYLYVTNWDEQRKVIMRYVCAADGALSEGRVFFSMQEAPEPEALDGLKVDAEGNLYASGPGGVWIVDAAGNHLGTIAGPELAANMAWGDADRRTLYMTARTGLYRLRLNVGAR
jgi:gluconolactonase